MDSTDKIYLNKADELSDIIESLDELPSSPAVVALVMNMTTDINADVKKLSRAIAADQAIAVKTIKLSNSPLYGRASAVGSIEEAILVLGFHTVRSLVVSTATYSMFQIADPDSPESQLWEHSLATAIGARLIARKLNHAKIEECYLAGLLHDVGKLILMQQFSAKYRAVLKKAQDGESDLITLEKDEFRFNHAQLGSALLKEWSFPIHLTEAVADHHLRFDPPRRGAEPIALIVRLANELTREMGAGATTISDVPPEKHWSAKALWLKAEDLAEISNSLKENFLEVKLLF